VCIVPRLTARFAGDELWARSGWEGTEIALTDDIADHEFWFERVAEVGVHRKSDRATLQVDDIFSRTPVALLTPVTMNESAEEE
jgi:hypothetical protein